MGLVAYTQKGVATITVVIDPSRTEISRALVALANHGVIQKRLFHSSNLTSFPKRINKDKEIHFGRNVSFPTTSALREFLIAYDKTEN